MYHQYLAILRRGLNINALMGLLIDEIVCQFLTEKLSAHYVAVDLARFTLGSQPITDAWLENCA
jgi:hypothetical protein